VTPRPESSGPAAELERLRAEVERLRREAERLRSELARVDAEHHTLLQTLEHSHALADVGLLAAGVTHDFNNLLQVIAGHTAHALSTLPQDRPEREALEHVRDAVERASELTRRLLSWARQEPGPPKPLDVNTIVTDVLELVTASAPAQVRHERMLASDLPPVLADPSDVRRVVLNLVVNAWEAIGDRPGEVRIMTGVHEGREPAIQIEVEDDGRGMDEETRGRAFEPFFSTRGGGSGLGLPTVRRMVEKLGGSIEVWSEPGHGTRFRVNLPAPREP